MSYRVDEYVDGVMSGRIPVGRFARLAVERHVRDLETGHERGLLFNESVARVVCLYFSLLRHWKGEWAGRPISLEPAQQFWTASLLAWQREDGTRRFRTGYLEVPRKNGKTTWAAGIALWLAFLEGEAGAEVYSAATKRDQARICHADASQMVRMSPQLASMIQVLRNNLSSLATGSKFEPLSSDANTLDGLNAHGVIADEFHAWRGTELWGVLRTATGSRRQPLILATTTAGTSQESICYQQRGYLAQILTGLRDDDSMWGIIYNADTRRDWPDMDEDDDWLNEATWAKANPLLGISKKWETMREDATAAEAMPTMVNNFLRWHLDIWTRAVTRWVNPVRWAACGERLVDEVMLEGRPCFGGLDLSATYDLSAFVLVFPPEESDPRQQYQVVCRFWLPEDNMDVRVSRDQVPYDVWARAGYITLTPGDVIDYDYIEHEIAQLAEQYEIREIAYDRWGATQIMQNLQEIGGDEWVVPMGQSFASMSPPMKELERLYMKGQLAHGNNPVLNWMAENTVAATDPAGNMKPDKAKATERMDGVVALIMALDRATRNQSHESIGMFIL